MIAVQGAWALPSISGTLPELESGQSLKRLGFVNVSKFDRVRGGGGGGGGSSVRLLSLKPIKAMEESTASAVNDSATISCKSIRQSSTFGKSTNVMWHKSSVDKLDREKLLQQKGCVIWITGLSGSGKSTLACALSHSLHSRGRLTYILDGDNCRHGLNCNLSFKAEDRAENIRRIGEVAKLFADAGVICIASLISPYRKDRDACRSLLPEGDFIEVFMDVPLEVCEARDSKGLYKLARAGKIKGFTGIDDPYEPPLNCEIVLQQKGKNSGSPCDLAETVTSYLDAKGYLQA
ncbi:hypothetical protein JRO89_XS08G0218000 [Xanthoceras sorbifolium]|uniref:Adenylyl-sulfate kinase n=1 Tax=Xanthoceras sorbifolium TaxID=99658 RepID=A0ABQ8HQU4_9ROSI|nr:hypothetical protein JRO89_XS08G0218000 [Xanthoceras sorbifolium]